MDSGGEGLATGQDAGPNGTAAPTGPTSESPVRDLLPLIAEPLPSSRKKEGSRLLTGAAVVLAAMMAGWERVAEALEAARDRLTDFPEFSLELTEALQRNTVPHPQLYQTALIVCFAPLISLVAFIVPISGPIDVRSESLAGQSGGSIHAQFPGVHATPSAAFVLPAFLLTCYMDSNDRAVGAERSGGLCLTPRSASSTSLRLKADSPPSGGAARRTRSASPVPAPLPLIAESSAASRKSERRHFSITLEVSPLIYQSRLGETDWSPGCRTHVPRRLSRALGGAH
ncbi:hypothetical protein FOZ60_004086 [Perkinsus olseni]|uniref:Uncharacterized protein n=1 Tax=Perkinsus olseni TaxID=32597 RepID=A0A7J6PHJ4_PEROL|nr:hypothetical protein FOZ60_004086 [Perkinsus olseni]